MKRSVMIIACIGVLVAFNYGRIRNYFWGPAAVASENLEFISQGLSKRNFSHRDIEKAVGLLQAADQKGDVNNRAQAVLGLAEIEARVGTFESAKDHAQQVSSLRDGRNTQVSDPYLLRGARMVAELAIRTADFAKASRQLDSYYELLSALPGATPSDRIRADVLSARLYRELGKYREAGVKLTNASALIYLNDLSGSTEHAETLAEAGFLHRSNDRYGEDQLTRAMLILVEKDPRNELLADIFLQLAVASHRIGMKHETKKNLLENAIKAAQNSGPDKVAAIYVAFANDLTGRQGEVAEIALKKALGVLSSSFIKNHPEFGRILLAQAAAKTRFEAVTANSNSDIEHAVRRSKGIDVALPILKEALQIFESVYPANHPQIAETLMNQALAVLDHPFIFDTRPSALKLLRRANAIYEQRMYGNLDLPRPGSLDEFNARNHSLGLHLVTLAGRRPMSLLNAADKEELFRIAQLLQIDETAVIADRASQQALGADEKLGALIRRREDLVIKWKSLDGELKKAEIEARYEDAKALVGQRSLLLSELSEIERSIADFKVPQRVLRPVTLADVQKRFDSLDALVMFLSQRQTYAIQFSLVVTKESLEFKLLPIWHTELLSLATKLSVPATRGRGPAIAAEQVSLNPSFDGRSARRLYKALFEPLEEALDGRRHLYVLCSETMRTIPMAVLLTGDVPDGLSSSKELRDAPWLIKKYSMTQVSSTQAFLAKLEKATTPDLAFLGVGNPILINQSVEPPDVSRRKIAGLSDLPETQQELERIVQTLRPKRSDILTGGKATKLELMNLPLSHYQIIVFATHGVRPKEIDEDIKSSALVLSGADNMTGRDMLLTSNEVSDLKLRADWVILSACNTGVSGRAEEGFSDLVDAFFHAGARSLLISGWAVPSDAAVELTTRMIQKFTSANITKAGALQLAMIEVMQDDLNPKYAHPLYWAPFSLVSASSN